MNCAYCDRPNPEHRDHIVSKNDRRRYGIDKSDERFIVACCKEDNWRKYTMRLVPPTHAHLVDELNALMAGPRWQIYAGGQVPEVVR